MAKIDVSEMPLAELQAALPAFEPELLAQGNKIYVTDFTQDFS